MNQFIEWLLGSISPINGTVILFGLMVAAPIGLFYFFTFTLLRSKSWVNKERSSELVASLRTKGKQKLSAYEKRVGIRLLESLERQLILLGGGKKAKYDPFSFLVFSWLLGIFVTIVTFRFTSTLDISLLTGGVVLILPGLINYISYLRLTSRSRKVFMPFVEGFMQTAADENGVVMLAFKRMGDRCPEDMRPVLEYINLRLSDGSPFEDTIWVFSDIMQSVWAHDFAYTLLSVKKGQIDSLDRPLNNLMARMQGAKNLDNDRAVIIKVVMLFIVSFTVATPFLMWLNMGFLKQARQIYFMTTEGINFIILVSLIDILSFIFALIWSRQGERL